MLNHALGFLIIVAVEINAALDIAVWAENIGIIGWRGEPGHLGSSIRTEPMMLLCDGSIATQQAIVIAFAGLFGRDDPLRTALFRAFGRFR